MRPFAKLYRNNTVECLWPYILRIVGEKPTHAYVLRKKIEKRFGFRPGTVTAYQVLYSLAFGGYVKSETVGRKRVYTITEKGRKELEAARNFCRKQAKFLGY